MANRSLNKVMLIGNLTRDPELKYIPSGAAVCNFGLATNRRWSTSDGQTKEDVQFHRVVAWNKLAELVGKLLTKGMRIYIEGRIVYRTFTGKDGVQRTVSEIVMDDFIMFGNGRDKDRAIEATTSSESSSDDKINEELGVDDIDVAGVIGEETGKEDKEKKSEQKKEKDENKEDKKSSEEDDDIPF